MQLSFHGAVREVTGSCYLVETKTAKFLVDCGMFQGTRFAEDQNYQAFDFDPKTLDFVLVTHAHFDHVGRLPKLRLAGFRGPIYATEPTRALADILLRDAARIIVQEAAEDRHAPLYTEKDIPGLMRQFKVIGYRKKIKIAADVVVRFRDAGHILGSSSIELWLGRGQHQKKLVFSGDLGNPPVPLLHDTEFIDGADIVVMESTYGGRVHEPARMRHDMLRDIIRSTIKRGGTLMIPAFAIERTQELLYEFNHLIEEHEVPSVPVYVDSPMAIKVTRAYHDHRAFFDKASQKLMAAGDDIFHFPKLQLTSTVAQSKKINARKGPKVIIAGSGMMTGGRISHHLQRYLPDPKSQLLIIGYQAQGTLGRELFEGQKRVKIHKQTVQVKAAVTAIGAYSAHADQPKLLHWVKQMRRPKPRHVFLTHGEPKASQMLADGLAQKLRLTSTIPQPRKVYSLEKIWKK